MGDWLTALSSLFDAAYLRHVAHDVFFDGIGASSNLLSPNQNASFEKEKSPEILPQDELKSPIGSKG